MEKHRGSLFQNKQEPGLPSLWLFGGITVIQTVDNAIKFA
jgi:hypothetical protein